MEFLEWHVWLSLYSLGTICPGPCVCLFRAAHIYSKPSSGELCIQLCADPYITGPHSGDKEDDISPSRAW